MTPICEMNGVLLVSMLQEDTMVIIWAGMEFKRHKNNSRNCRLKSKYFPFKNGVWALIPLTEACFSSGWWQAKKTVWGRSSQWRSEETWQITPPVACFCHDRSEFTWEAAHVLPPWHGHLHHLNILSKEGVPEKENLKSQTSNRFALDMMRRFGRDGPGCLGQMFSTSFKALPFVFSAEWSNPQAEEGPACEAWTNFSHKHCGFILFILLCVPFQKKMKAPRFKGKCKKPFWGKYKGGLHRPPKLPLSLMMMNFKKLTHHLCIPQPFLECSDVSGLVLGMIIQKGMRYSPCPEGLQLEKQVNHVSKDTNENLWIYASKTVPRVGRMLSQE